MITPNFINPHDTDMADFYEVVVLSWAPDQVDNPRFEMVLVAENMFDRFDEVNELSIVSIRFFTSVPEFENR